MVPCFLRKFFIVLWMISSCRGLLDEGVCCSVVGVKKVVVSKGELQEAVRKLVEKYDYVMVCGRGTPEHSELKLTPNYLVVKAWNYRPRRKG